MPLPGCPASPRQAGSGLGIAANTPPPLMLSDLINTGCLDGSVSMACKAVCSGLIRDKAKPETGSRVISRTGH